MKSRLPGAVVKRSSTRPDDMNTLIDQITAISGPFTTDKARAQHCHWLGGLTTMKLESRLAALQESERRVNERALQRSMGLRYSR